MRHVTTRFALIALLLSGCGRGDERVIVVVGFEGTLEGEPGRVMTSVDGGKSWSLPQSVGDGEWLTEVAAHGDRFLAIGFDGGIYDSDPQGIRWTKRQLHDGWLEAVHFPAEAPGVGFVSGVNAAFGTRDGGETWSALTDPPDVYFEDFAFADAEHGVGVAGFLVPQGGSAWRTSNGGASWTRSLDVDRGLRAVARVPGSGEIWTAGDLGALYVSTNGGASFADVSGPARLGPTPDFTDLDFTEDGWGWLVGSYGAARSYRGRELAAAHRWTRASAGDLYLQGVLAIDRDRALACGYRNFSDRGVVVETTDGGRTWRVLAETPGIFWYSIAGIP